MKNESGKHYFSLDTNSYSNYPDEQEILLQAGLIFEFESKHETADLTIIKLKSSESLVRRHNRKQSLLILTPFLVYFLTQVYISIFVMNWTHLSLNLEFGLHGLNAVYTSIYTILILFIYASFHVLIKKYKYYQWYPSLICVMGHYISFTSQQIFF